MKEQSQINAYQSLTREDMKKMKPHELEAAALYMMGYSARQIEEVKDMLLPLLEEPQEKYQMN